MIVAGGCIAGIVYNQRVRGLVGLHALPGYAIVMDLKNRHRKANSNFGEADPLKADGYGTL